jgi:autotransporter translocation and assembly factor TamB
MAIQLRAVAAKTWRSVLRISLLLLLTTVIILAMVIGTEGGRIGLVRQGLSAWQVFSGQRIELTGLRSPGLGQWKIGRILVEDLPSTPRIELSDVDLQWQWRYAIQNRWWFKSLSIDSVRVDLGEPKQSGGENFSSIYEVWPNIPAIRLERLHVNQLRVTRPRYPDFKGELNGQAEINWGAIPARFLVSMSDAQSDSQYALQLSADAIDQFRLQGSLLAQPESDWARWINWELSEPAQANWNVKVDYSQPGFLAVDVDDWALPWKSHILKAQGQLLYDIENIKISFLPMSLTLDDQPASLEGWIEARDSELFVSLDDWTLSPFAQILDQPNLNGRVSINASWLGGWQQPRLDGRFQANGQWNEHFYGLSMTSVAGLSSLNITEGQLSLANNQFDLEGNLDWVTNEIDVDVIGTVQTDPLFRDPMPDALSELQAELTIAGRVTGNYADPLVSLTVKGGGRWRDDPIKLAASARWSGGELNLSDLYVYSQPLQLKGTLNADTASGVWQGQFDIVEWRSDILSRLNIQFPVPFTGSGYGNINLNGQGTDIGMSGDIAVQGLWQQWPVNAQIKLADISNSELRLGASSIRLDQSETTLQGSVNWSSKQIDLTLEHQDWPLASLPPWFGFWPEIMSTLDGDLTGKTRVHGLWNRPAIDTDSKFIGSWFEEPITLSLVTRADSANQWQVPVLQAQWLEGQWRYQGQFKPYDLELNGQAGLENIHVKYIPLLSREFTGSERSLPDAMDLAIDATVDLRGKLTSPALSGDVAFQGFVGDDPLDMTANIGYLDTSYVDIVQAQGTWANGQWVLDGLYDWRLNQWAMNIETDTKDTRYLVPWLQLALNQNTEMDWLNHWTGNLQGRMQLDNRTKDWLIDGDLSSSGLLYDDDYSINWRGTGRLNQALNHQISSSWGSAEVTASLISDTKTVDGRITSQWLSFEQMRFLSPQVPDYLAGLVNADIGIQGDWSNPSFQAQIASTGQFEFETPHRFNANIDVSGNANSWSINQSVLEIPNALQLALSGEGEGLAGQLLLEGILPDTRYWIANDEIGPGESAFKLDIDGDFLNPNLNGQWEWRAQTWPITLKSNLSTLDEQYRLETTLRSNQQTRMSASMLLGQTPWLGLLQSWRSTPFELNSEFNTPMSVLDPFFADQPDIAISGDVSGRLNLSGTLISPNWQGDILWSSGTFEHAAYGSLLSDVNFMLSGVGRQLNINGKANDGAQGRIALTGGIDFTPQEAQPLAHNMSLSIEAENAHLLNQAQMDAALSGTLDLNGSYHDTTISGQLSVSPLTMQSDTFLWDGAPQLNIVNPNNQGQNATLTRPTYWPDGQWDVSLLANNRVNLYGQGISAELAGELELSDNLYQPVVAGRFDIVRGTYSGLGQIFTLTNGSVQIQNNQLVLDIQGEGTAQLRKDGTLESIPVVLRITGNQDALNLALSSSSAEYQDQDELLALLLFGKIVSELDFIQAIQLANVVNKLRTANSGFDIIGETRDSFNLDALVIDTQSNEEGNLTFNVSAGKYINDFLYLEVEQGVGAERDIRGSLQYQVTPNTNVELFTQSESGELESNGIELNWSWDY